MVNYPHKLTSKNNIKKVKKETVDFANRGMTFEKMINDTNDYYLSRGLAVIHKKPTPVQIVKVDYPKRSRAKHLLRTTREFTVGITLILKPRKRGKSNLCL